MAPAEQSLGADDLAGPVELRLEVHVKPDAGLRAPP